VIAEYDGNDRLLRKYIYGARIDEPVCMIDVVDSNALYYYHFDGVGSVVALSDSEGDSVQSYEYSVYGQVAVEDPNFLTNPYMFTGRRFDIETGLYHYRARCYNPHIGRFMQTDPVGYDDGINWYLYCNNNPLNMLDPFGLWVEEREKYREAQDAYDDAFDAVEIAVASWKTADLKMQAAWKKYDAANVALGVTSLALIKYCILSPTKAKCVGAIIAHVSALATVEATRASYKAAQAEFDEKTLIVDKAAEKYWKAEAELSDARDKLEACKARNGLGPE
jgi:RHS repeat-associated protein